MKAPAGAERPNILVLLTDQHAAHMLGCAGAGHVATPHVDRLAAQGTRFDRAYTTFPLCVPARGSLLTGRYPHELGVNGNAPASSAPGSDPGRRPDSLGHLLRAAGYDTLYAGKWHARTASATPEDGFTVLRPFGDAGLADACARWLTSRVPGDRPFALVASFDDPHTVCEYARDQPMPYGDVPAVPVRRAPPLPSNFGRHPYEPEAVRHEQAVQAAVYGTVGYTPDDWRRYRHTYARLVERADAALGTVLDALHSTGAADDTLVVFTSDHGDGDAAHAWNQKTALFEEAVRVPLVIRPPGGRGSGGVSDALVSVGLDLLPTLCAAAGVPAPPGLRGRNLLAAPEVPCGHDHIVVETLFERPDPPLTRGRSLITARHKYTVYSWGRWREQLHDLRADPGETRNLAVEESHDALRERLRATLLQWCLDTGDTDFLKRLVLPDGVASRTRDRVFAIPY
ncbi:sulfatase [Streptomyces sp. NPDC088910]|uniref:sulfatase family protein n=1 Tax=Streptomyces sp. NPDC088910 TaxID=3365911 RepID=UPI003810334C